MACNRWEEPRKSAHASTLFAMPIPRYLNTLASTLYFLSDLLWQIVAFKASEELSKGLLYNIGKISVLLSLSLVGVYFIQIGPTSR
jgi:hypothetical protein